MSDYISTGLSFESNDCLISIMFEKGAFWFVGITKKNVFKIQLTPQQLLQIIIKLHKVTDVN